MAPTPQTECLPLKSWSEFLEWERIYNVEEWKKKIVPLAPRAEFLLDSNCERVCAKDSKKKSLFCHDMKGGYLDDRFINGITDLKDEPYHFSHWSLIDIFVYFSHSFISIPPLGWINGAHKNGVSVLGTIILEGHEFELLSVVLNSYELFAEVAASIQKSLGFEGWLLNFEMDKLSQTQVIRLLDFTKRLTSLCPTVIWYDSVTVEGNLDWRNQVDAHNYEFFKAASGIYLNYAWSQKHLQETDDFLNSHNDQDRKGDVFVGVDIFGRGCPGGGGFDSDVALNMIAPFDFSVALFAPAWTYENRSDEETFLDREYRFWDKLRSYLNVRGMRLSEEDLIKGVKFGFQPGCGQEMNDKSNQEWVTWWLDLRRQEIQPSYLYHSLSHVMNGGLEICSPKSKAIPILFSSIPSSAKSIVVNMIFETSNANGEVVQEPELQLDNFKTLSCSKDKLEASYDVNNNTSNYIVLKLLCFSDEINLIRVKYFSIQML